ncbi:MAG TPA: hypothetical protein VFP34_16455 [Microlunatus sp.]|nr:hypothetical protein [Microlunatus sp.]
MNSGIPSRNVSTDPNEQLPRTRAAERPAPDTAPIPEPTTALPTEPVAAPTRREVIAHQRRRFGGMKFGACFFGWLTATGLTLLLATLLSAVGLGVTAQMQPPLTPGEAAQSARWLGVIIVAVVILIAYYAGGYVAGRMARFDGIKQGVGVWLWAIVVAVVLAVVTAVVGTQFDLLSQLQALPQIPVDATAITAVGVVAAVAVTVASLVGAVLGGLAGVRYHRRIDRVTDELLVR